jgi:hypothetical protein
MTALYTWDAFFTLDGFGSYRDGHWGGYRGKAWPELLDRRRVSTRSLERSVPKAIRRGDPQ